MKRFIVYVLLAALTSMAMPGMNISFAAETVFSISAEDNAGTGRSQINISLNGINLNDLYAYEAVLSFDSEKLELIKAVSEINGFSVSPKIKGDKAYIAFTKVGDVNGENGNMKLSTITSGGKYRVRLQSNLSRSGQWIQNLHHKHICRVNRFLWRFAEEISCWNRYLIRQQERRPRHYR